MNKFYRWGRMYRASFIGPEGDGNLGEGSLDFVASDKAQCIAWDFGRLAARAFMEGFKVGGR